MTQRPLQGGSPRVVGQLDLLHMVGLNRSARAERRGLWCEFKAPSLGRGKLP